MKATLLPSLLIAAMTGPTPAPPAAGARLPFNRENVTKALKECHIDGGYSGPQVIIVSGLYTRGTRGPDFAGYRRCLDRKLVLPPDFVMVSI